MENEVKETKVKKEKKKGVCSKVVIVLLIIVILGLVGYIAYDKEIVSFGAKETKEKNNKDATKKEENKTEEKEQKAESKSETKQLDLTKSLNTKDITYKNSSDVQGDYGLSMSIDSNKKSITLSIDWNKFGPLTSASAYAPTVETYNITGFSKNIVSTFIGDVGQDSTGITLFYIMEDGTVEYTPLFIKNEGETEYRINYTYEYSSDNRITGQHFETKGLISGVKGVIKLYNVDAAAQAGWRTTIGATKDGSFYDLGNEIN